jgi:PAS domain S-box-containing protein
VQLKELGMGGSRSFRSGKGPLAVSLSPLDQAAFRRRLRAAVAVPVIALIALAVALLALIGYLQATARWVDHSDEVLAQATRLERLLVDREIGVRGYLVTRNATFLGPYQQAQPALEPLFETLSQLVADNPTQTQRLAELRGLANTWDESARRLLALGDRGADAPLQLYIDNQQYMDRLHGSLAAFLATETELRDDRSRNAAFAATIVVPISVLLSLGVGGLLALTTRRQLHGLACSYEQAVADTQAQAADLTAIRRYNELLLTSIGEGICGLDQHGQITFANPAAARLTGWEPDELLGRPMHERLHHSAMDGETHPPEQCPILATLRDGATHQVSSDIFLRKDGTPLPVEYTSSPLAEAGMLAGAVIAFRDIGERLRLESQLLQAQKLESIGRLSGGIAHDFNNLLTTIVGAAELATDELPPDHPARQDLQIIQSATDRASALTRQLLAFARKQPIVVQMLDLNELLVDIDRLLRRLIGANISLVAHPTPNLWPINADRNQIEQVLINLAVNARDAMPEGGKLTIETANVELDAAYTQQHLNVQPGSYVMLAVSDTGLGMTPEVRAQIFEPFFSTKESGKGTGLGLSTSYGIVKQHGGALWVYSEVDHGTTFKIYLPRAVPAPTTPDQISVAEAPVWGIETILLAEDEEPVRLLAARILRDHGYTVLEAATGDIALRLGQMHTGQIDLLLADIVLPEMGGAELAGHLTTARPGIKVLFVSGYPEQALVHQGRLAMPAAVLLKPFAATALLRAVRAALET